MRTKIISISFGLIISFSSSAQKDGAYHLDEVYSIDPNGTLYLRSEDANVRITGTDRDDIRVVINREEEIRGITTRRDDFEMEIEEKAGNLYLTEKNRSSKVNMGIGFYRLDYEITIELPSNASLKIDGEDDDYLIRSVNGKIGIDVEDGDIELIDCKGNDFDFEIEDGDLSMDGGGGKLYANIEDGDLDLRNGSFTDIDIVTEDGDVLLETTLTNDGVYDFDGEDATLEFLVIAGGGRFNISRDDARVTAADIFKLMRETDSRVSYELEGGTADVSIRTQDGRVRLSKR